MIITRAPLRISLGGGGTDLPAYYTQYGGELTSAAINKYVYIAVKRRFDDSLRVSYNKTEIVDDVEQLQHPIVRETLRLLGLSEGLEIISIGDVPANTGLGSSGSFTVALLLALHTFKGEHRTPQELAEESFTIQADILGEPIGKQDEYMAAYGGVTNLLIDQAGGVIAQAVSMPSGVVQEFEHDLLLFYTGIQRKASDILAEQGKAVRSQHTIVSNSMHHIKTIGQQITAALVAGQPDRVGELMHDHWVHKQQIATAMAPPAVSRWYDVGRACGAIGGKLVGAGGGGFLLLYCPHNKPAIRQALAAEGLRELHFRFDSEGAKVVMNMEERSWVTPALSPVAVPYEQRVY